MAAAVEAEGMEAGAAAEEEAMEGAVEGGAKGGVEGVVEGGGEGSAEGGEGRRGEGANGVLVVVETAPGEVSKGGVLLVARIVLPGNGRSGRGSNVRCPHAPLLLDKDRVLGP